MARRAPSASPATATSKSTSSATPTESASVATAVADLKLTREEAADRLRRTARSVIEGEIQLDAEEVARLIEAADWDEARWDAEMERQRQRHEARAAAASLDTLRADLSKAERSEQELHAERGEVLKALDEKIMAAAGVVAEINDRIRAGEQARTTLEKSATGAQREAVVKARRALSAATATLTHAERLANTRRGFVAEAERKLAETVEGTELHERLLSDLDTARREAEPSTRALSAARDALDAAKSALARAIDDCVNN